MSRITFSQVSADEARIYDSEGDYVGDVFRQPDILCPGEYFYVVHLSEDPRGPVRVHERRARSRGGAASPRHPPPAGLMPARTTETGPCVGRELPPRRDVRAFHACSLQQPCGSSGRSAPYGLTQDGLRRAVNVADREVGLRELSNAECVAHRPLTRGRCVGPALAVLKKAYSKRGHSPRRRAGPPRT